MKESKRFIHCIKSLENLLMVWLCLALEWQRMLRRAEFTGSHCFFAVTRSDQAEYCDVDLPETHVRTI